MLTTQRPPRAARRADRDERGLPLEPHRFAELSTEQEFPAPRDEVFDFFSDARNLEAITPPRLRFEILSAGEIDMGVGALIDYRMRLLGVPFRWRTEITAWDPPLSFVDEQARGPYHTWVHRHEFHVTENGTRVVDRVLYHSPGGILVRKLFVTPQLEGIFSYRQRRLAELLSGSTDAEIRHRPPSRHRGEAP